MKTSVSRRFKEAVEYVYGKGSYAFIINRAYDNMFGNDNKSLSGTAINAMLSIHVGVSVTPKLFFRNFEEQLKKEEESVEVNTQEDLDKLILASLVEAAELTTGTLAACDPSDK